MRKELLSTPRFTVERREYPRPDGGEITRFAIVHPGAAVILPILDDGRIVLIRQIREVVEEELWELPAGTLEPDEPPINTAGRELIEETGYRAGVIEPMVEFFSTPGICTEIMHVFRASKLEYVGQELEPTERIRVALTSPAEAKRLLLSGQIRDGKTVAVLGLHFANLS